MHPVDFFGQYHIMAQLDELEGAANKLIGVMTAGECTPTLEQTWAVIHAVSDILMKETDAPVYVPTLIVDEEGSHVFENLREEVAD